MLLVVRNISAKNKKSYFHSNTPFIKNIILVTNVFKFLYDLENTSAAGFSEIVKYFGINAVILSIKTKKLTKPLVIIFILESNNIKENQVS